MHCITHNLLYNKFFFPNCHVCREGSEAWLLDLVHFCSTSPDIKVNNFSTKLKQDLVGSDEDSTTSSDDEDDVSFR